MKTNFRLYFSRLALSVVVLGSTAAWGFDESPNCMANKQVLALNNEQVLNWKTTTKNQYHNRAHILGPLVKIYPDKTGHHHMQVQIGDNKNETIEVIYNEDFGPVPQLKYGQQIEACGDYITSNARTGSIPASPDGAIVHWVHKSPNPNHDSGFIVVDGVLCGQESETAPPKPRR